MILGIDPSLRNTGVVLYEVVGTRRYVRDHATLTTSGGTEQSCSDILSECAPWLAAANAVAIEAQAKTQAVMTRLGRTNAKATYVREIARMLWTVAIMNDKRVVWVEPNQLRGALGLRANASKGAIRVATRAQLIWSPGKVTEHEADAAGVAVAGERMLRQQAARRSA